MSHSNTSSDGTKTTSFLDKVYATIEQMPIYNWIKILEGGGLEWLFKTGKGRVTQKLGEHWLSLQQQYIDEFGLDENYRQQLRLMHKLLGLNCQYVITRDRTLINDIKMLEIDLSSSDKMKAVKFYEVLDHVEKYKGFSLDPHKTSVIKWYYSLKNMSTNGKAD